MNRTPKRKSPKPPFALPVRASIVEGLIVDHDGRFVVTTQSGRPSWKRRRAWLVRAINAYGKAE